jgi:hypothetical protein
MTVGITAASDGAVLQMREPRVVGRKAPLQERSPDCSGLLCSSPGARHQEVATILHSGRSRHQVTRVPLPNGAATERPCGSADTVVAGSTMPLLLWSIVVLLFAAALSLGMLRN